MPYSEALAERIRLMLAEEPGVREQRMFGGLAFLIGGHMAVAASGHGGVMVRVSRDESDALVDSTPAELMEMGGRRMAGWLRLRADDVSDDVELETWVRRGVAYARSLPPKS